MYPAVEPEAVGTEGRTDEETCWENRWSQEPATLPNQVFLFQLLLFCFVGAQPERLGYCHLKEGEKKEAAPTPCWRHIGE